MALRQGNVYTGLDSGVPVAKTGYTEPAVARCTEICNLLGDWNEDTPCDVYDGVMFS